MSPFSPSNEKLPEIAQIKKKFEKKISPEIAFAIKAIFSFKRSMKFPGFLNNFTVKFLPIPYVIFGNFDYKWLLWQKTHHYLAKFRFRNSGLLL